RAGPARAKAGGNSNPAPDKRTGRPSPSGLTMFYFGLVGLAGAVGAGWAAGSGFAPKRVILADSFPSGVFTLLPLTLPPTVALSSVAGLPFFMILVCEVISKVRFVGPSSVMVLATLSTDASFPRNGIPRDLGEAGGAEGAAGELVLVASAARAPSGAARASAA